jgi:hypothetical protein
MKAAKNKIATLETGRTGRPRLGRSLRAESGQREIGRGIADGIINHYRDLRGIRKNPRRRRRLPGFFSAA